MNNKEAEIEEFRKRKKLCTEDTLRRMKSDEEFLFKFNISRWDLVFNRRYSKY
jgi:hypothetical protein